MARPSLSSLTPRVAGNIGDKGVPKNKLPKDFCLGSRFGLHNTYLHIQPRSQNTFLERESCFLELGVIKSQLMS
jgi:hypothetical protein